MLTEQQQKVVAILARRSRKPQAEVTFEKRLVEDLGLDGDDAIDAISEICKTLSLKVECFDASVHFRPEPNIFSIFRKRRTADKMPLTVGDLIQAAEAGVLRSADLG